MRKINVGVVTGETLRLLACLLPHDNKGSFYFQVNHEYASVMFDNKVQIHLIDNDDGERDEEKETKLFPDG